MPTIDTTVNNLIINKLTQAQYDEIQSPSETELYLVPDTIDNAPTSGSNNPVKSGGVYTALQDKADKSEMSVVDGTGADADKTTITLKNGTSATVIKQHQDISGKQDTIDSTHKLSADLVDDSNTINKFTNATEKQTWNNKYTKPATGIPTSDLEDDLQGHVYVDLGLPSGTLWATRNVGAVDELDAGDYYKQGKGAKKYDDQHIPYQGHEDTIPFRLDTARQVWGDEWRMPTAAEFNELLQYTDCTFTNNFNNTDIPGLVFEKYGDPDTYIFLPAGGIYGDGQNHLIGSACYLSAIRNQGSPVILEADYGDLQIKNGYDDAGYNVRPVRSKLATGSGNSDVPTLNAAPTSSTVTYTKDGQTLPFEIGQFCRVPKTGGGYDFYQLYDLVTESNVTTATWKEVGELPSNVAYISSDSGVGIVPEDGIRAETVTSAATMTVNPDVVTVINGVVGTAAITLQVPNDNLAHVWDILLTTDSSVAITFAMSNSETILYPNGFSVGASKAIEISVIGVGTKYYLRYGEFA